MNARSRLKPKQEEKNKSDNTRQKFSASKNTQSRFSKKNNNYPYIRHFPLLVLSAICFGWLTQVATKNYPNEIANVLLAQSYLPILVPFFLSFLFLLGYITLNIKRGFVLSLFATLLVFFRLQQISFEIWWLSIFAFVTLVAVVLTKKN